MGAENSSTIRTDNSQFDGSRVFYINSEYLNLRWDSDLTNTRDDGTKHIKAGYPYYRPYGWKKIAMKVLGKYQDDNWLCNTGKGSHDIKGEWAVTYSGTNCSVFNNIAAEGYKVGPRGAYGRGVYSSPYIEEAAQYSKEFSYEGEIYKGVFKNRVNPDGVQIVYDGKYWLCPDPLNIRPYALCVQKVNSS